MRWWEADEAERERVLAAWARLAERRVRRGAMVLVIDDVGAAMVLEMDDDELQAHAAGLRERLWAVPQGNKDRCPLLAEFGRACAELNARGLYEDGEPDGHAIRGDGAEADVIDGAAFWDEG